MIRKLPITGRLAMGLLMAMVLTIAPYATSVFAHKGATGVVKIRMNAMKDMKSDLKEIEQMLEGKTRYSSKKLHKALDNIRDHGGARMSKLFPKGTAHKPSEADPAIWKNWDEFEKMAVSLNQSTDEFRTKLPKKINKDVLKSLRKDVLVIRKTCKNCHDRFRL